MKKRKWYAMALAATLTASALAGCGGSKEAATQAETAGTEKAAEANTDSGNAQAAVAKMDTTPTGSIKDEIHYAINGAPSTLDVQTTTVMLARTIANGYIYESLMAPNGTYEPVPQLAESCEVSDDFKQYTYKLRQNVKFHDGTIMTADDVVASMNRWIEKFSNAQAAVGDARFEKVDDTTVTIQLAKPNMFLNTIIATGQQQSAIMPKSVIEDCDAETGLVKSYIGTGPYKFVEWVPDQHVELQKFADYTPVENSEDGMAGTKTPVTEKIFFEFVSDDATRVNGVQSGEYDIAYKMPYDNYDLLSNNSDVSILNEIYGDLLFVYNKKGALGKDAKIRKAVATAMNMDDILTSAYANASFYRLNSSYMLEETPAWYSDKGEAAYNLHDADLAKQELTEAGYNGETFTILVSTDYADFYNAALVVQQELQSVGMKVELLTADWATFLSYRADETKYDAFITSASTSAIPTNIVYMGAKYAGWSDDEKLQGMLTDFYACTDEASAKETWDSIQDYCSNDYIPAVKFGDIYRYSACSAKVGGVTMFNGPIIWNAFVAQ